MSEEDYVDKQCIKKNLAGSTPTRLVNLEEPLERLAFKNIKKLTFRREEPRGFALAQAVR